MMRTQKNEIFLEAYNCRVNIIKGLLEIKNGADPDSLLGSIISNINKIIELLKENPISKVYFVFKELVTAYQRLVQWENAIRNATADADRFHRAYKQHIKEARKKVEELKEKKQIMNIINSMDNIETTDDINKAVESLSSLSLPLPIYREESPASERNRYLGLEKSQEKDQNMVVFLEFKINNDNVQDPHVLEPNKLYDLTTEARLSRWPKDSNKLVIQPLSSLAPENYEMPTFEFVKDDKSNIYRETKKMQLKVEQTFESQPLEFIYQAYLLPEKRTIAVTGMNRINIRSESEDKLFISGYEVADINLKTIWTTIYKAQGLTQEQRKNFLFIMKNIANIAGQALQSNDFDGVWDEKQFQQELRKRLRQIPEIGSDLLEHPNVAKGITDLFFKKIPIELKVINDELVTLENVNSFSQQEAQYTAGSDNRLGILCILDCSEKKKAPGSLANDIGLKYIPVPGYIEGEFPLILGVVIIRGNLKTPSSFSN